jgi:hypothetical protein
MDYFQNYGTLFVPILTDLIDALPDEITRSFRWLEFQRQLPALINAAAQYAANNDEFDSTNFSKACAYHEWIVDIGVIVMSLPKDEAEVLTKPIERLVPAIYWS